MWQSKESCEVGLYVHIPFCRSKCYYCGFYSRPIDEYDHERVISAIIAEISRYDLNGKARSIYIGGGSPSCLPPEELLRLVCKITSCCGMTEEFTVEVNPGQAQDAGLKYLHQMGVNRISIGAQSFVDRELEFLRRRHSVKDITKAVSIARDAGFDNVGLDLIFAIPGSDIDSWRFNIESALCLDIEHISAYSLTYEDGTRLKTDMEQGVFECVDEDIDRDMYELAIDMLSEAGFVHYEISNFARPGYECQHNLIYWANEYYVGVGPGASSYFKDQRYTNIADINRYTSMIDGGEDIRDEIQCPSTLEIACETAVLNLRRIKGVCLREFHEKTGFDFMELFAEPVMKYFGQGLIEVTSERVSLKRSALAIADSILCDFSSV